MRRYLSRLLLVASVVLPLAAFGAAHAQTAMTITMTPTAGREPGLTGTSIITPTGANQVRVDITINGLKPNDDRAAHIHSPGTMTDPCDTGGPVVYPLTDVKADASGKGTSTTTVTFDAAKGIPTVGWYTNVHVGAGANTGLGVICGKIASSLASTSAGGGAAAPSGGAAAPSSGGASALPATGTAGPAPSDGVLIAVLALASLTLAGMGVLLSRRS